MDQRAAPSRPARAGSQPDMKVIRLVDRPLLCPLHQCGRRARCAVRRRHHCEAGIDRALTIRQEPSLCPRERAGRLRAAVDDGWRQRAIAFSRRATERWRARAGEAGLGGPHGPSRIFTAARSDSDVRAATSTTRPDSPRGLAGAATGSDVGAIVRPEDDVGEPARGASRPTSRPHRQAGQAT